MTAAGQTAQRLTIGTAVGLGLLGVASTSLNALPLRVVILVLALLLLTVVTALVHAGLAKHAERRATREQAVALRDLLSSWPLRTPGDISAYALGVRSPAASVSNGDPTPEYVKRDIDPQVHDALAAASVVLLVGPQCAGKSRTALHALETGERTKDAGVIAPDDADSLRQLLACPSWVIDPGEHYVLWLDDLERYLDQLHLRKLDAFIRSADRDRSRALDVAGVVVVATLREDVFLEIFRRGGDDAHVLRGFIARAERIMVPARLSADELTRVAEAYPAAPTGASFAEIFGATMVQLGHPLYTPPQPSDPPRRRWPSLSPIAVGLIAAILAGALILTGARHGWMNPPPLANRFAALENRDDPCGGSGLSPTKAAAIRSDVVRVVHRADGCAESDLVEIYPRSEGTLAPDRALALQATDEPKLSFRCLGPDSGDPCHPDVFGNKRVIVGALVDSLSRQLVPVAIYRGEDGYVPRAIHLAAPGGVARASSTSPALARPSTTIEVSDRESGGMWRLQGSPVTAAVMLPARGDHGATLVAAYAVGTHLNQPELRARAYELRVEDGLVRPALICDGTSTSGLRFRINDSTDIADALRRRYVRAATAGRVRCEAA